ncbi:MAG: hypothetical protein HGA45_27920 [Chloroflexales bacterium]|nr:hypothetical protein [Chloroflexales bacterium]
MVERYPRNMTEAAETVWQLASKADAVGLQQISYTLVAPRLQQEALRLQQLHQAIQASHSQEPTAIGSQRLRKTFRH